MVQLDQLQTHEKTCLFGDQACRYCRVELPSKDVEAHELKCEDRSVVCSKQCGLRVYPNRVCIPCMSCRTLFAADAKARLHRCSEAANC